MPRIKADNIAEHVAQQRAAVLDAAVRLFVERGFSEVGLADVAAERPGRGAGEHVDLAGLQRDEAVLARQREIGRLGRVVEDRGRERTADIGVEALPDAGLVLQREAWNAFAGAADDVAACLDLVERRLGEGGSRGGGRQDKACGEGEKLLHGETPDAERAC